MSGPNELSRCNLRLLESWLALLCWPRNVAACARHCWTVIYPYWVSKLRFTTAGATPVGILKIVVPHPLIVAFWDKSWMKIRRPRCLPSYGVVRGEMALKYAFLPSTVP